jgi:acyl carrier protein
MNAPVLSLQQLDEVRATLRAYVVENHLPPGPVYMVSDDEDLFETGVLDSAALLSFLTFVEAEYGLSIPDEDLIPERFATLTAVATYILHALQSSATEGGV